MIKIEEEALKRFPPSMAVEGFPGEDDRFVDDEWGYDEAQRSAFIVGAIWARQQALEEAEKAIRPTFHLSQTSGEVPIAAANTALHRAADVIHALTEETP